jgi:DNA-binding response OmpR family regulator
MHIPILSDDGRKGSSPNPKATGPCQNGAMSDSPETDVSTGGGRPGHPEARILLYSDDRDVRKSVRVAVGDRVRGRDISWMETATHPAVVSAVEKGGFDLLILDGEAAKAGGMGISRQLKHEIKHCPPVLLLVGRRDDAWLATWSEADRMVVHPIEPFETRAAVDSFFEPAAARTE